MEASPTTPGRATYLTASHDEYHEQSPNCAEKDTKAQRAQAEHFLAHACSVRTPAHEPRWPLSQSPPSSVWPQYPTRDSLKSMASSHVACNRRRGGAAAGARSKEGSDCEGGLRQRGDAWLTQGRAAAGCLGGA